MISRSVAVCSQANYTQSAPSQISRDGYAGVEEIHDQNRRLDTGSAGLPGIPGGPGSDSAILNHLFCAVCVLYGMAEFGHSSER